MLSGEPFRLVMRLSISQWRGWPDPPYWRPGGCWSHDHRNPSRFSWNPLRRLPNAILLTPGPSFRGRPEDRYYFAPGNYPHSLGGAGDNYYLRSPRTGRHHSFVPCGAHYYTSDFILSSVFVKKCHFFCNFSFSTHLAGVRKLLLTGHVHKIPAARWKKNSYLLSPRHSVTGIKAPLPPL